MARRYPIWFAEGNFQAYLDEDTRIIYDAPLLTVNKDLPVSYSAYRI